MRCQVKLACKQNYCVFGANRSIRYLYIVSNCVVNRWFGKRRCRCGSSGRQDALRHVSDVAAADDDTESAPFSIAAFKDDDEDYGYDYYDTILVLASFWVIYIRAFLRSIAVFDVDVCVGVDCYSCCCCCCCVCECCWCFLFCFVFSSFPSSSSFCCYCCWCCGCKSCSFLAKIIVEFYSTANTHTHTHTVNTY